jgi:hypothetical protein
MIRELWLRMQVWSMMRLNPRLQVRVARNDVGDSLGVRCAYIHASGRRDSMALSHRDAREGSNAAIIVRLRDEILHWVGEVESGALHTVRG